MMKKDIADDEESYAFEETSYFASVAAAVAMRETERDDSLARGAKEESTVKPPGTEQSNTEPYSPRQNRKDSIHSYASASASASASVGADQQARESGKERPSPRTRLEPPARHIKEDHEGEPTSYVARSSNDCDVKVVSREMAWATSAVIADGGSVSAMHHQQLSGDPQIEPSSEVPSEDSVVGAAAWQQRRQQAEQRMAREATPVASVVMEASSSAAAEDTYALSMSRILLEGANDDSETLLAMRKFGGPASPHLIGQQDPNVREASILSERTWSTFDNFRSDVAQGDALLAGSPQHATRHHQQVALDKIRFEHRILGIGRSEDVQEEASRFHNFPSIPEAVERSASGGSASKSNLPVFSRESSSGEGYEDEEDIRNDGTVALDRGTSNAATVVAANGSASPSRKNKHKNRAKIAAAAAVGGTVAVGGVATFPITGSILALGAAAVGGAAAINRAAANRRKKKEQQRLESHHGESDHGQGRGEAAAQAHGLLPRESRKINHQHQRDAQASPLGSRRAAPVHALAQTRMESRPETTAIPKDCGLESDEPSSFASDSTSTRKLLTRFKAEGQYNQKDDACK